VSDVNFERTTVTFRPHSWRRLKTATSSRLIAAPRLAEPTAEPLYRFDQPAEPLRKAPRSKRKAKRGR
jgi:hypothetical protein